MSKCMFQTIVFELRIVCLAVIVEFLVHKVNKFKLIKLLFDDAARMTVVNPLKSDIV